MNYLALRNGLKDRRLIKLAINPQAPQQAPL